MNNWIIAFSYSFIAGTGFAIAFFPNFDIFKPLFTFSSLLILHWLLIFCGILLLLWILLGKYKFVRNTIVVLLPFLLGATNYWRFFNTKFPSHIKNYLDKKFWDRTTIRGTVIREPDIRPDKINLTVKPYKIKKKGKWKELKGRVGNVLVRLKPSVGEYYETCDYGDIIEVSAALLPPMGRQNPCGFDYKEYLRSMWGVYACMYPRDESQVKKIGENPGWLLKFALDLKKEMIRVIKKTLPYPQSAFLGGVTLGTRGGVPPQMKFEFQATGVAHVLSVSGLHAGFIAALFYIICTLLKIPKKPRWFIVSFGLLIFTLITGARPATMRASIMYSMLLFFNTFGLGLKASTALTIPVSGMLILIFNPLLLPSASFVLSYMAVWSLCHLSGPVQTFFETHIRSWYFVFFFFVIFGLTTIFCLNYPLFLNKNFLVFIFAVIFVLFLIAKYLHKINPIEGLEMSRLSGPLVSFFYAQFAIQLGMMIPFSAVYFRRFPAAGAYVNFIAIPLIGFIVMVGFLSGLIGAAGTYFSGLLGLKIISDVATFIALCLNAGNYWLCKLFTGTAHFFFKIFPYPFMPTFHTWWLVSYYVVILLMVNYRYILDFLQSIAQRLKYYSREDIYLRASITFIAIVLLFFLYTYKVKKTKVQTLRATVLCAGFGNSIVLESPSGKSFLIDTSIRDPGGFNFSSLSAVFSCYHINEFQALILSNLKPENTGNVYGVLEYFPAKEVITPYDPAQLLKRRSYQEFLNFLGDFELLEKWDTAYPQKLYANVSLLLERNLVPQKLYRKPRGWRKIFTGVKSFPLKTVKTGDIIYSEKVNGKEFYIMALWPPEEKLKGTSDDIGNNSVVLRVCYGNFSMLLPSDIRNEAELEMIEKIPQYLKSHILVAPYHGHMNASYEPWLNLVKPEIVIIHHVYARDWSFPDSALALTIQRCKNIGAKVLRTSEYGAITIISDGEKFKWAACKKQKKEGRSSYEDSLDVF